MLVHQHCQHSLDVSSITYRHVAHFSFEHHARFECFSVLFRDRNQLRMHTKTPLFSHSSTGFVRRDRASFDDLEWLRSIRCRHNATLLAGCSHFDQQERVQTYTCIQTKRAQLIPNRISTTFSSRQTEKIKRATVSQIPPVVGSQDTK